MGLLKVLMTSLKGQILDDLLNLLETLSLEFYTKQLNFHTKSFYLYRIVTQPVIPLKSWTSFIKVQDHWSEFLMTYLRLILIDLLGFFEILMTFLGSIQFNCKSINTSSIHHIRHKIQIHGLKKVFFYHKTIDESPKFFFRESASL